MMDITKIKLVVPEEILFEMKGTVERFSINTNLRLAHFLAQCSHESAGFHFKKENLNYSTIGLLSTFPKYFPDKLTADAYSRQPEKIANRIYANRMGNGDELSGDGWRFRGRGFIQCTGRSNYEAFFKAINEPLNPELLEQNKYACLSAGWFWDKNNLNKLADLGSDDKNVMQITKVVNGGYNGLSDRQKKFKAIFTKLNSL